jgi:hypothetical protein
MEQSHSEGLFTNIVFREPPVEPASAYPQQPCRLRTIAVRFLKCFQHADSFRLVFAQHLVLPGL